MDLNERLSNAFLETSPEEAARNLENLPAEDSADMLELCPPDVAAKVLHRVTAQYAAACLSSPSIEHASSVLAELPSDVGSDVARRLSQQTRDTLLTALPGKVANSFRRLLQYPLGTAGSLMDPFAFTLPDDMAVSDALVRVKELMSKVRYYVYLVDRDEKLTGVLTLRELMSASSLEPLSRVMRRQVFHIQAFASHLDVIQSPYWNDLHTLPVVDRRGVFLGVLRYETVRRLQDDAAGRSGVALNILLAMSELLWVGLSGMIGNMTASSKR